MEMVTSESLLKVFDAAGETYVQSIDVSTDAVLIRNADEDLILTIDRSAAVFDVEGKKVGQFDLERGGGQYRWHYKHKETGEVLICKPLLIESEVMMVKWLMEKAKEVA